MKMISYLSRHRLTSLSQFLTNGQPKLDNYVNICDSTLRKGFLQVRECCQGRSQGACQWDDGGRRPEDGTGCHSGKAVGEIDAGSNSTRGHVGRPREGSIPSRSGRGNELGGMEVVDGLWVIVGRC